MSGGPTPTKMHRLLVVEDDHCIAILPMRTIGGAEVVKVVEAGENYATGSVV